jgi:hypothetical protein
MVRNIFLPGRLCLFGLYVFITVANLEEKEEEEEEEILYLQYTR